MADFDAPSFSLGFDFDLLDSDPQIINSAKNNNHQSEPKIQFSVASKRIENDDFETLTVVDSDSECVTLPKLKRLRRGSAVEDTVPSGSVKHKADLHSAPVVVNDDDIEDFSSPEDNRKDGHLSTQNFSVFNSSKVPLSRHSVLTKESGKRKQTASNGSESVLTSCNKQPFPKLTVSPLRKFQLVDSDSDFDDPSVFEATTNKTSKRDFEPYSNQGKSNYVGLREKHKLGESSNTSTKKDLWDDFPLEKSFSVPTPAFDAVCDEYFSSKKENKKPHSNIMKSNLNSHIPTPAFDAVCDEYFSSKKEKNKPQSSTMKSNLSSHIPTPAFDAVCEDYFSSKKERKKPQSNITKSDVNSHATDDVIDLDDPRPPAHQYFFHIDPRVQALVRTRLPNFCPLNSENIDSRQPSTSNIDYMGQFGQAESVKRAAKTTNAGTSSRKTTRKPVTQEVSQSSNKRKVNNEKRIPKDVGKRRVQADGQGAAGGSGGGTGKGHWFTSDGRRVYVCKNGQEHTGKAAYILYKKESAGGFKNRNMKKKTSTKKK